MELKHSSREGVKENQEEVGRSGKEEASLAHGSVAGLFSDHRDRASCTELFDPHSMLVTSNEGALFQEESTHPSREHRHKDGRHSSEDLEWDRLRSSGKEQESVSCPE